MRTLTYRDAIHEALVEEMARHPHMIVMGEDLIPQGGAWGVHKGLSELYPGRIRQTPISEAAIAGLAVGAALAGGPVVAEIMFNDFTTCCMDEIVNQAAKIRYMTGGQAKVPLVVRAPCGLGKGVAAQHSQSLEAWFVHVPGLKVAMPSRPEDAKGLLKTAIRGEDPVMLLEPKLLYAVEGPVPEGEYTIPFGQARVCREGGDLTIIATGRMVARALEAAVTLAEEGFEAEVIDPRTLVPIDWDTLFASVEKTNRVLVVEEAVGRASVGAELAATIGEQRFGHLDGPVRRLSAPAVPKPFSPPLEKLSVPDVADILRVAREMR
jgi:pyruvate/2-oxoglutarate/acetoin dehydrogenase E1 component